MKPLLIEILTEELPALPLLKELPHILGKWQKITQKYHIHSNPHLYFTPRRIVLQDEYFPIQTQSYKTESFGPPVSIAFIDGEPSKGLSKAGESFFKKLNLSTDTPYQIAQKNGKDVLYYVQTQESIPTKTLLPQILESFLDSLQFGKTMRWGDLQTGFVRPIRNIMLLLGEENILINAFGLQSKAQTYVHRDVSLDFQPIKNLEHYHEVLQKGKVILHQEERKALILDQIRSIESTYHIQVEIDQDLLQEVVAITEYPRAAYGTFDEEFLKLPNEVIITSMKENQRYFATYQQGQIHNGFVLVSNSTANDLNPIILGNQKVLKARLSDAVFFYENDLKNGFKPQKLADIMFVEGLGNLQDKAKRESAIALSLLQSYAGFFDDAKETLELLKTAIEYARADLVTEMVYEFPELQGIMGFYYAKNFQMHPLVCLAIKEQYLPTGENSALPSDPFSALVALSIKLDHIFSLFSINEIPSGSKDPFALRRAANGVIKIIQSQGFAFNLSQDIPRLYAAGHYQASDLERIENFFLERLEGILKVNPSLLRCVFNARVNGVKQRDLNRIIENVQALSDFFEKSDKQALITLFKRVANILKDASNERISIDPALFKLPEEKSLYEAFTKIHNQHFAYVSEQITALFALKDKLELFFENVLVNDSDVAIKANRQMLICHIYDEFLKIGDIKEITL